MKAHAPTLDTSALKSAMRALTGTSPHTALSALCAAAKGQAARAYIRAHIDHNALEHALQTGDAKTRKNAARLMGALEDSRYECALLEALAREETRLVRPSLLLALGALGGQRAKAALEALPPPEASDPTQEKHAKEEAEALRRALGKLSPAVQHAFTGFSAPQSIVLLAPQGFSYLLQQELKALDIQASSSGAGEVYVATQDIHKLLRARCYYELLFPLGTNLEADKAAFALKGPFLHLLQHAHAGAPPFFYRVECRNMENRSALVKQIVQAFDGDALVNNPSKYEAELRLEQQENGRLKASCKLYTIKDSRFSYRKRALPASIAPATAACIARYAKGFAPGAKRVLDPCCGSGTLLVEWGKLQKNAHLTGVDISKSTLEIARENIEAAGLHAGLIHKDCAKFLAHIPYDLVVCNLPFGNRVGNHENNQALYMSICKQLPAWLSPGGVAVLYTMEYRLLQRCIEAQQSRLLRLEETRTEAGGLLPHVVVVKYTGE